MASNSGGFGPPRRHIEEIHENQKEELEIIEEIKYPPKNIKTNLPPRNIQDIVCWNCRSSGHLFMDCHSMQRNLFCYKCGLLGVITPKCPKCSGNDTRSVTTA